MGSQGFDDDFIIDAMAKCLEEIGEQLAKNKLSESIYQRLLIQKTWYFNAEMNGRIKQSFCLFFLFL